MSSGGCTWTEWSSCLGTPRQTRAKGSSNRAQLPPNTHRASLPAELRWPLHVCVPLLLRGLVNLGGWAQQKAWHPPLAWDLLCWSLPNGGREQAPRTYRSKLLQEGIAAIDLWGNNFCLSKHWSSQKHRCIAERNLKKKNHDFQFFFDLWPPSLLPAEEPAPV